MWGWFGGSSFDDVETYLAHYPGQKDDAHRNDNVLFYTNKKKSRPDGWSPCARAAISLLYRVSRGVRALMTVINVFSSSGDLIDNIHRDWWGDYRKLEWHHG
jgi:hypothetical protein